MSYFGATGTAALKTNSLPLHTAGTQEYSGCIIKFCKNISLHYQNYQFVYTENVNIVRIAKLSEIWSHNCNLNLLSDEGWGVKKYQNVVGNPKMLGGVKNN